ncbi:hypothetical protein HMPREF9997_02182 [Corynebacterium durum F0235]|uniref:Uncharacterized protein n=1 Tax=Corynebacterium durum F0235 TaxID=1035195 RepID=L1MC38_9CORY|nr:hypothetical protein HMPREF9997_02182 [Corynebacterium durum F0235]
MKHSCLQVVVLHPTGQELGDQVSMNFAFRRSETLREVTNPTAAHEIYQIYKQMQHRYRRHSTQIYNQNKLDHSMR